MRRGPPKIQQSFNAAFLKRCFHNEVLEPDPCLQVPVLSRLETFVAPGHFQVLLSYRTTGTGTFISVGDTKTS